MLTMCTEMFPLDQHPLCVKHGLRRLVSGQHLVYFPSCLAVLVFATYSLTSGLIKIRSQTVPNRGLFCGISIWHQGAFGSYGWQSWWMLPSAPLISGKEWISGELSLVEVRGSRDHSAHAGSPAKSVLILARFWEGERMEGGKNEGRAGKGLPMVWGDIWCCSDTQRI